jgi:hypothetical protein
MREKSDVVRGAWSIDDKSNRRAADAFVFTFAVMVLLRGFEANPAFAAVMAVALGLYARFVLGVVVEEYAGGTAVDTSSPV